MRPEPRFLIHKPRIMIHGTRYSKGEGGYATGGAMPLRVCWYMYIYMREKKFDGGLDSGYTGRMADPIKQKYYRENREARLAYQKRYYERYRQRRPRVKELAQLLEPEQVEAERVARSEYNRNYYAKNRDELRRKRAALRRKRRLEKQKGIMDAILPYITESA